jgi:hypothetical protein
VEAGRAIGIPWAVDKTHWMVFRFGERTAIPFQKVVGKGKCSRFEGREKFRSSLEFGVGSHFYRADLKAAARPSLNQTISLPRSSGNVRSVADLALTEAVIR